jgi:nucleotide-binding universal stress UspA family protein
MFKKALVPLDGSDLAEGILPYVSQLATGLEMTLVLLSVVDPDEVELPERLRVAPSEPPPRIVPVGATDVAAVPLERPIEERSPYPHEVGGPYASQVWENAQTALRRRHEEITHVLGRQGVKVESLTALGKPADEIVRVAEQQGCDLIAMSTHGRTTLGRGILGSVTDKVLHTSNLPTLTITPERAAKYHAGETISAIMCPLDGSPLAETALPYVEELARRLSMEVLLVRVLKIGGIYAAHVSGYPYAGVTELEAEIEADATEYMKEVAENLKGKGLSVRWKLLKGAPAQTIVDLAHEEPQDLIVLTTHGRSGLTRWVIGSVAEAVIRASGDAVLVIPPPKS